MAVLIFLTIIVGKYLPLVFVIPTAATGVCHMILDKPLASHLDRYHRFPLMHSQDKKVAMHEDKSYHLQLGYFLKCLYFALNFLCHMVIPLPWEIAKRKVGGSGGPGGSGGSGGPGVQGGSEGRESP